MTGSEASESVQQRVKAATVVVMGVAGSGKSTIGTALAGALGWRFCEGDMQHSAMNVEKMSRGVPLTDEDRAPWLVSLRDFVSECQEQGEPLVITCSALKAEYRNVLAEGNEVLFVFLRGDRDLIEARMESRADHYMGSNMLASQFEALEEPRDALTVDASGEVEIILEVILEWIAKVDRPSSRPTPTR